jgi:hypothetical protein
MNPDQLKALSKIILAGWRSLALADQSDADALLEVLKEVLEGLEEIEAK